MLTRDVTAQARPSRVTVARAQRPVGLPGGSTIPATIPRRPTGRRLARVLPAVLGLAAAYLAVDQLTSLELVSALARVDPAWAAFSVLVALVPLLGAAISLIAFTPGRLPFGRAVGAQVAASFVGVVLPPTVGQLAVNARLLQRLGYAGTTAAAVVGLTQISSVSVTLVLLGVALALNGDTFTAVLPPTALLLTLVVLATMTLSLLAVRRLRQRLTNDLLPQLRLSLSQLRPVLRRPVRIAAGLGGNLLLTAGYVVTLDAALRAFDVSLSLPQTAVVLLIGNAVGSAAPTPGGVGAVETALTAGLVAVGVPVQAALPAVLLFRLATVWLHLPPGWAAFTLLQRRGLL